MRINRHKFPDHNISSEETGSTRGESGYTWVIDPLDGTKEFIRGIPLYCTAVCLQTKNEVICSAVYDPSTEECYSASKGNGGFLNGRRIQVYHPKKLTDAMVFAYLPKDPRAWNVLGILNQKIYRIRGHANHNMAYCWVAKGGYDGHLDLYHQSRWWDIAPGYFILREAGGKVTDENGIDITPENYREDIICTNGHIHDVLLESLNAIRK